MESHLLQMRGLKHRSAGKRRMGFGVASFTDAWIETEVVDHIIPIAMSHLLQMRGLKQVEKLVHLHRLVSHLLQMRGLKQPFVDVQILDESRIFYRCVD